MRSIKWLEDGIDALLRGKPITDSQKRQISDSIHNSYESELSKRPTIAIIGPTGVGKSSTINALFGSSLPVSDTRSGTYFPVEVTVDVKSFQPRHVMGSRGDLLIYDMPGIGEDLDRDKVYEEMYRKIIYQCDVAVWVVSAVDRRLAEDQRVIRDVVRTANKGLVDRLVIGVNKVDSIQPRNWNEMANLPSRQQEKNLDEIVENVKSKLLRVCPGLVADRIVPYSAEKRYHLIDLFNAMLLACPRDRAWVLDSRRDIANYWELVNPQLRKRLKNREGK